MLFDLAHGYIPELYQRNCQQFRSFSTYRVLGAPRITWYVRFDGDEKHTEQGRVACPAFLRLSSYVNAITITSKSRKHGESTSSIFHSTLTRFFSDRETDS